MLKVDQAKRLKELEAKTKCSVEEAAGRGGVGYGDPAGGSSPKLVSREQGGLQCERIVGIDEPAIQGELYLLRRGRGFGEKAGHSLVDPLADRCAQPIRAIFQGAACRRDHL